MSGLVDPARLQKEIDAQKKRAAALALLGSTGGEQHYKPGEIRRAREGKEGDNTLEVVTLRRAQETYKELSAKERLLRQQNSHREDLEQKRSGSALPLKEGWREVKDSKTGGTYYWNKSSNATSWTRPVMAAEDIAKKSSSTTETNASASGAGSDGGGSVQGEVPGPLPSGWREAKDPKTGGVYFWHQGKGETTWTRPSAPAGGDGDGDDGKAENSTRLPDGWKAVTHAATGQTHYVHESSGKRSFTLPGAEQQQTPAVNQSHATEANRDRQAGREVAGARGSDGRDRGSNVRGRKRERSGRGEIDPLDPLGQSGGKWSEGLVQVGERMADSTASGPLWQQRPYPAPGKILRSKAPSEADTAGPRQKN